MAKNKKDRLGLTKINYLLLAAATALLILGYIIMGFNDISISPVLLTLVYVALIPFALLYKPKEK